MRHLFTRKHFSFFCFCLLKLSLNKQHCFIAKLFKPLMDYARSQTRSSEWKTFFLPQTLENLANSNCERFALQQVLNVCSSTRRKIEKNKSSRCFFRTHKLKIHKSNSTKQQQWKQVILHVVNVWEEVFLRYLTVNKFHEVILFSSFPRVIKKEKRANVKAKKIKKFSSKTQNFFNWIFQMLQFLTFIWSASKHTMSSRER